MRSHLRRTGKIDRTTPISFNLKNALDYRPDWPWETFEGSDAVLKWSFRDLRNLDEALKLVPGRDAVVQAGANIGLFPKRLAEEFKTVYTFEPDPVMFLQMGRTAPEANIIRFQAALGCERQLIRTSSSRRDASGRPEHEGLTHVSGAGVVPTLLIDDLALKRCDLIYLDIEGFELNALKGATKTIERCRPVIGVEINGNCLHYGTTEAELRSWIKAQRYKSALAMNSDEIWVPL